MMMLVTAIPIVGQIMVLVWAFAGENESRKNYYRAILAWILVAIGLVMLLAALGSAPAIMKQIQAWVHKG